MNIITFFKRIINRWKYGYINQCPKCKISLKNGNGQFAKNFKYCSKCGDMWGI